MISIMRTDSVFQKPAQIYNKKASHFCEALVGDTDPELTLLNPC